MVNVLLLKYGNGFLFNRCLDKGGLSVAMSRASAATGGFRMVSNLASGLGGRCFLFWGGASGPRALSSGVGVFLSSIAGAGEGGARSIDTGWPQWGQAIDVPYIEDNTPNANSQAGQANASGTSSVAGGSAGWLGSIKPVTGESPSTSGICTTALQPGQRTCWPAWLESTWKGCAQSGQPKTCKLILSKCVKDSVTSVA